MACGHLFEVCGPVAWGDQLIMCGLEPSTETVWPGAINLKCVAWGHLFEVCGLGPSTYQVCGLGPSKHDLLKLK